MKVSAVSFDDLARSVIAVPPMARHDDLSLDAAANARLISHLSEGGVSTFMYGGNANFYNIGVSEYAAVLNWLVEAIPPEGWIIPSVGPDYGKIRDQIPILKGMGFPTVMALPFRDGGATGAGTATALRHLSDKLAVPVVLYLRDDDLMTPDEVAALVADGVVGWIKYAVVREDPAHDPYLAALIARFDRRHIFSGIGERPVIAHFEVFGLRAFTSGSVSVAPRASSAILAALKAGDPELARWLRSRFLPLETCRDRFGPGRVLHEAVSRSVAPMGPVVPMWGPLSAAEAGTVAAAAAELIAQEATLTIA